MLQILKEPSGYYVIKDTFAEDRIPLLEQIGYDYVYTIPNVSDMISLTTFTSDIEGINNTRNVETFYSFTDIKTGSKTDWYPLYIGDSNQLISSITPYRRYDLRIKWVRTGTNTQGAISIKNFSISGVFNQTVSNSFIVNLGTIGQEMVVKPLNVYKVFKIDGVTITTQGETANKYLEIKYRISQDSGRNWTNWEFLNNENITTVKFTPIRFFWIEYLLTRKGTNADGHVGLVDIELIGDIQNVTADSKKTNLLGIRDCCQGNTSSEDGSTSSQSSCELPDIFTNQMTDAQKTALFDPYSLSKEMQVFSKMNADASEIFGWKVQYFITDPDVKGIDYTLNEYQLYNVVCEDMIKITVDQNQFPDNQIVFNQFDLTLFETFEVQISKETFKQVFGVNKRPSKEDFLWFCDLNRMFTVEHAQPFRNFNNAAIYYRVVLVKHNKKANVIAATTAIEDRLNDLRKNSTLEDLFSTEIKADKTNVANKVETHTLSKDLIRYQYSVDIATELVENSDLVIAKYHYIMSGTSEVNGDGVIYFSTDNLLLKGDNRAVSAWFKIDEYVANENYNIISNLHEDRGYDLNIIDEKITFKINGTKYDMSTSDIIINDNVWYCVLVNVDQRQRKISTYLYSRNVDPEMEETAKWLDSSELKLIKSQTIDYVPEEFEFDEQASRISIKKSNLRITNIKIYNTVLEESIHTKALNQNISKDTEFLILSDNCNKRVYLNNFPLN